MQPGISTHVFFDHRLHPGHLDALLAAGAHTGGHMTIEVFAARHHFDYTEAQAIRELASWFRSNDVTAVLHQPIYTNDLARAVTHQEPAEWSRHIAPNLNLISARKSARIAAMDEVKRALETAEQIPFAAAVLHLGLRDTPWDEAAIEYSITAIEHLKAFAGPLGIRLLLENLHSETTTPEHLLHILKAGHFDSVGVCLDIGHLHLSQSAADITPDSGVHAAIRLLGPRIAQLHLHDNHGPFAPSATLSQGPGEMKDEHLWPCESPGDGASGAGTIDWPIVLPILATLPENIPFILEPSSNRGEPIEGITSKARETFNMYLPKS
jgi:sugar phosphate isomerase/epimerase